MWYCVIRRGAAQVGSRVGLQREGLTVVLVKALRSVSVGHAHMLTDDP
jgi:hypothetical protein